MISNYNSEYSLESLYSIILPICIIYSFTFPLEDAILYKFTLHFLFVENNHTASSIFWIPSVNCYLNIGVAKCAWLWAKSWSIIYSLVKRHIKIFVFILYLHVRWWIGFSLENNALNLIYEFWKIMNIYSILIWIEIIEILDLIYQEKSN